MTTREDASALVQRMQECFNTRQFDQGADLHTPGFFSHPLGTTGFEAGKDPRIVLGGKAYAMMPYYTPGSIDIVEPGGKSCGTVTTTTAADRFFIGRDGTLIDLTGPFPHRGGPNNHCTAAYYPQLLPASTPALKLGFCFALGGVLPHTEQSVPLQHLLEAIAAEQFPVREVK